MYYVVFEGAYPVCDSDDVQPIVDFCQKRYTLYGDRGLVTLDAALFQDGELRNVLSGTQLRQWLTGR